MSGTVFVELPCADCEAEPLSGEVAFFPTTPEEALKEFLSKNLCIGGRDYHTTYTAFHYGEDEHLWEYSHYESYHPSEPTIPAMIVLRYRPLNQK